MAALAGDSYLLLSSSYCNLVQMLRSILRRMHVDFDNNSSDILKVQTRLASHSSCLQLEEVGFLKCHESVCSAQCAGQYSCRKSAETPMAS